MARSKQSPVLLLPQDEEEVLAALRHSRPGVQILDGSVPWVSADSPPVCTSIAETGTIASIWNPEIFPTLPVEVRSNGSIRGPQAGPVVQWMRSPVRDGGRLEAGRWAATMDDNIAPEMIAFIRDIWKVLFRLTGNDLARLDLRSGDAILQPKYRVGPAALQLARSGDIELYDGQMKLVPSALSERNG